VIYDNGSHRGSTWATSVLVLSSIFNSNSELELELWCWWRLGLLFDWISALLALVWSAEPDFKPKSHIEIQFKRL